MEFVGGGELFNRLSTWRIMPNDVALFYTAEICLALEYLHNIRIIYRDLKPENILVGRDGHIKLTDLGFAKIMKNGEKTFTLCGTPEYMAPEIILNQGHFKAADWWAFGVLVFELLTGFPPFYSQNPYEIYNKVLTEKPKIPEFIDYRARDLISNLLCREEEERLGVNSVTFTQSVKNHEWFEGVDFDAVYAKDIPAPWIPPTSSTEVKEFPTYPEENLTAQLGGLIDNKDKMLELF
jgi:protein kinase A/protein kinase X